MNRPLWIINSSMLGLLIACLLFIALYRVRIQAPVALAPEPLALRDASQYIASIDQSKIYANDLFGTFIAPVAHEEEKEPTVPVMPTAPIPRTIQPPQELPPRFLEPLNVTLTGIIWMPDQSLCRAIVIDNTTKQEVNYKVGDELEDAQIIRIARDHIVCVRSNGQQESIYLTQLAATLAQENIARTDWSQTVVARSKNNYLVDVSDFVETVASVGEFIELADLATAYIKGKSIGCKIGAIERQGLIAALGFKQNDIITSVNGHSVYTAQERLAVAQHLMASAKNSVIKVEIMRASNPLTLTYTLGHINRPEQPSLTEKTAAAGPLTESKKIVLDTQEEQQVKALKTREKFAPTLQEIERDERRRIMNLMKKKTI